MATLPICLSWSPPPAVPAAPRTAPPVRAMHVLPQGGRRPSPAPIRMQARKSETFRSRCHKEAAQHPEFEPEPEPEEEALEEADAAESSESKNLGVLFCESLDKQRDAYHAAMGVRVAPDMFLEEEEQIFNYTMKMPHADILNLNAFVLAQTVCLEAVAALDLASKVMDIAGSSLDRTEISQSTANQMVRTYASIFCNVAKDAYHKRVEMESIISFLDALRGLGAICHILVGAMVAKVELGPIKDSITSYMDTQYQEFDKKLINLTDEFTLATKIHAHKIVTNILFRGTKQTNLYICRLVKCRKAALPHIKLKRITYPRNHEGSRLILLGNKIHRKSSVPRLR
ncbi:hypothetical protein ACP70R_038143 [Stipagrostis hirtigluma subsp. patula]